VYIPICYKKVRDTILVNTFLFLQLFSDTMSGFSLHLIGMWHSINIGLALNMSTRDFGGRTKNLPAGWVANNSLASPLCKGDFWMLSHAGLLGSKIFIMLLLLILNSIYLVQQAAQVIMC
jgi:hypothetical protein